MMLPPPHKPISVLLTVRELGQGGCERDLTKLAVHIDRSKFEPHVGCFRPDGIRAGELKRNGIPIIHIPVRSFRSGSTITGASVMGDYMRRHNIRLVQAFDVPTSIFCAPVCRLNGIPVLTSQLSYRSLAPRSQRLLLRIADRTTTGIVVNCRAMERHVVEGGFDPGAVYLCYNGIDTDVFRPWTRSRPAVLQDADVVIGIVCALRPEKDLLTLVEAFSRIDGRDLRLKLLFVGSGPMLPELQQRSVELGVADRCVFQPATPDVAEWLRAMDIFVLPSTSEAFSNALMEAMACECAVVASRVGGNPELVFDGDTGLLFEPRDADGLAVQLRRLSADTTLRKSLARNAARFILENFSVSKYARRMEEVYSEVLGMHARKPDAELHPAARA